VLNIRIIFAYAISAAVWVSVAHGGAFNACGVTYDYDGTLLLNGSRFFPVGNYFLPQGYPEGAGIPNINQAYEAFAANGGNILFGPRYYNMYGSQDIYGVHGLPSDIYYDQARCVDHLNAADAVGVKLMTCPHINWWWDTNLMEHPIWIWVGRDRGWPIGQGTQEERFDELNPNGGIKGWIESGASGAFMGWHHWHEAPWLYWHDKVDPPQPPHPPTAEPSPTTMETTYDRLKALEADPAVNAQHAVFFFVPGFVRFQDLLRTFHGSTDIIGLNVGSVPEPYSAEQGDLLNPWG
jgi:hypothetical protein